ncbi:MAG: DUF1015 domain-containing protein [Sphaerochaetaceae bacterium]|nr:DUF1015 domain-containing protein [Spirochaetales bacterium]MDY5967499.1 DUF1015 domain-containing protein [Sphaerochaetaceae bacterium]
MLNTAKEKMQKIGCTIPNILLPNEGIDLSSWAVIACDQFTSQREYWKKAGDICYGKDSTLHMIFPEVYLEDDNKEERIGWINNTMNYYKNKGVFKEYRDTLVLVKRTTASGTVRYGLMLALDLDAYSWEKGAKTLIRATEGTILSRIPPRVAIRKNAILELPHILVLISDKKKSVIEPLVKKTESLKKLYQTSLMLGGGEIEGWAVDDPELLNSVADALCALKEGLDKKNPLLFAMGDGNHSFATAKQCWEDIKGTLSEEERKNHPARYCLVEIENVFDKGIEFEAIHRAFFNVSLADFDKEIAKTCKKVNVESVKNLKAVKAFLKKKQETHSFALCSGGKYFIYTLDGAKSSIPAGSIQRVIEALAKKSKGSVDYIHGYEETDKLGNAEGNIGIFLPAISKDTFFDSIVKDGALPRKTFSMGEAEEKRYYMEGRYIK